MSRSYSAGSVGLMDEETSTDDWLRETGRIRSAFFGLEPDRSMLTIMIELDFGGSGQYFQLILSRYDHELKCLVPADGAADAYVQLCRLLGVAQLSDAVGNPIVALRDAVGGPDGLLRGLERLPCDGEGRFVAREWAEKWGHLRARRKSAAER